MAGPASIVEVGARDAGIRGAEEVRLKRGKQEGSTSIL